MDFAGTTITLFNGILECFDRIQLARNFDRDFAICALTVDILQVRLSRWGQATGIISSSDAVQRQGGRAEADGDIATANTNPTEKKVVHLLSKVRDLLDEAQEDWEAILAGNGGVAVSGDDDVLDPSKEMQGRMATLHTRLKGFVKKSSRNAVHATRSVKWAFYKKADFEAFVGNIAKLFDELEKVVPEESLEELKTLTKDQCKDMSERNLKTLKDIAEVCDPLLKEVLEETMGEKTAGDHISFTARDNHGIMGGKFMAPLHGINFGSGTQKNYSNA